MKSPRVYGVKGFHITDMEIDESAPVIEFIEDEQGETLETQNCQILDYSFEFSDVIFSCEYANLCC